MAFVLVSSGDQMQHLLWRLAYGELLLALTAWPNSTLVALIGTNKVGVGFDPNTTTGHRRDRALRSRAHARLARPTSALRRGNISLLSHINLPRCARDGWPQASFWSPIVHVNRIVAADEVPASKATFRAARGSSTAGPSSWLSRMRLLAVVAFALMPNANHHNAAGHRRPEVSLSDVDFTRDTIRGPPRGQVFDA